MTRINDQLIRELAEEIAEKVADLEAYEKAGGGIDLRVRKMEVFKLCCRYDTLRLQSTIE